MSWLHYLIEANIYLGVFYLCYCLFLNRDTHYTLGRVYLIFSCLIAFVLPLTQLSILKPVIPEIEIVEPVKQVTVIPIQVQQIKLVAPTQHFTFDDAMIYLYITGAAIALFVLMFRLRKLFILTRANHSMYQDQYKLINLSDENTAFSFFNYLFIGSNVPQAETVIAHEMVHIRQKHSIDIILLEILKVVNWFNPFIYLTQRSLKTIHEYIADEQTAAHEQDALAYSYFLLNNAYGIQGSSIAHSFFNYNLLKKRIIMLNKNRSGKLARLKYLAALPLCAGMLCASTLVFSKDYSVIDLAPRKTTVPVVKPDSVKYTLKVTDKEKGITVISDKVVYTDEKTGNKTVYTPATLTPEQQAEALENRHMLIERVVRETVKPDTAFAVRPPAIFKNGYVLQEDGYLIDKKTEYFTLMLTDKSGKTTIYNSTDATPAERKMLNDKFGYKFFNYDMKGFVKRTNYTKQATNSHMLPPPPPPVPVKEAFGQLAQYISQKTIYPKEALDKNITSSFVATLKINEKGNITEVTASKNDGNGFVEAFEKAARTFPFPIKDKAGIYKADVAFFPLGKTVTLNGQAANGAAYIGQLGVVGLTPQQKRKMNIPPPPPAPPVVVPDKPAKIGKTPPPPPAPPKVKADQIKLPPPVVVPDKPAKVAEIEIVPPAPAAPQINRRPPPPMPNDPAYTDLLKYVAKKTHYPATARDNKINGHVILSITINSEHKIAAAKVEKGIGYGCDEEAARAIKTYEGAINKAPGTYKFITTFILAADNDTKFYSPKPIDNNIGSTKNLIGQVVVTAYL